MARSSFTTGLKIAKESNRGTAPSALTTNWANGSAWNLGGAWYDVVTDGMPDLKEQREIIYPQGYAGKRFMNQQQAVEGRVWSEGGFSAPVVGDYLGLLLLAALGESSTNKLGTQASLLVTPASVAEPINTNPKSFVLTNQPADGGKIIGFEIKGTKDAGTISVCGVDAQRAGASELITFASGGVFFTKTAFSAIGASSLAVSGVSAASLTVTAFDGFTHTFTPASGSSGVTLAIERHGVPEAGAASKSFIHTGMALRELSLHSPAQANDGIFSVDAAFEG